MRVLLYNELDTQGLKSKIDKVVSFLEAGNFVAAQVKKLRPGAYYRAKLDDTNRLLFRFARHGEESVILVLETIRSHRYENSRFLGDRACPLEEDFNPASQNPSESLELKALPQSGREFRILDKVICFDQAQSELIHAPLPLIVIGSAGSGKTALILERMRLIRGDILYLSLSSFLVENCRKVYHSYAYSNENQNIDFLSLHELMETIAIPDSKEIEFNQFSLWFRRYAAQFAGTGVWQIFEEFRGVISGTSGDKAFLSNDEYVALGPKQSIFPQSSRPNIYALYLEYQRHLAKEGLHDPNIAAFRYLSLTTERYDAVIIDELQDFTVVQILLAMKLLRKRGEFIFCGDSNQVVHPNFFSWSKIKSMFYDDDLSGGRNILRILGRNYRCAPCITELANKLLRIKQARFGSIDRESHYLIEALPGSNGEVSFLSHKDKILRDLNDKTKFSTHHAVVVLDDASKEKARRYFQTPLVFSVREAKGLEYENIVLYNPVSEHRHEFKEICNSVDPADLMGEFNFSRNKDKNDRSAEAYKFFINGLYVALSRAMTRIYWFESDEQHPLLSLIDFKVRDEAPVLHESKSSLEEWQNEARRLELQGRTEQAEDIRRSILRFEPVPWPVLNAQNFAAWMSSALHPSSVNKESQRKLYALSLQIKSLQTRRALENARFGLAGESWDTGRDFVKARFYKSYYESGWHGLKAFIRRHGVDFRNEFGETPLMIAAREGLLDLAKFLLQGGADPQQKNFFGLMPIQMLMLEIFAGRRYDEVVLNELFKLLAPEVLSYRSGNRLIKTDCRLIEYLLLLAAAPFMILKSQQSFYVMQACYTTTSLETMLGLLPINVFPEKRRKKTYLSAALSRNEVLREGPYNRKLFVRLKTGHYVISPRLFWGNHEEWTDFYSSLNWESLTVMADRGFIWSFDKVVNNINKHFNETERSIELLASSPNQ